jgi:hypothetical protein
MARLEMTLDGPDAKDGHTVLKAARALLSILRDIEGNMTGKRPKKVWEVDILSARKQAIVVLRAGERGAEEETIACQTAREALQRMRSGKGETLQDKSER